jgi:hypothetical protein
MDQRTGQTLPEDGFLFTGSKMVPSFEDPQKKVYAADEYQPMAIVSLFNSTYSVLEVPYSASKGEVYQNTRINPEHKLPESSLLTLLMEPVNKDHSKRVKDLVLQVHTGTASPAKPLAGLEYLNYINFQLKDATTVINKNATFVSVLEALDSLDKKQHDYFLTVDFGDDVKLREAQALAKLLSVIDCEKGVRIDPPPTGQLYYKAFIPDKDLLDRDARLYHPWELYLSEKGGAVSGKLLDINSVYKNDSTKSELEIIELPVSDPKDLRKELDDEVERTRKDNSIGKPPAIMVFAPSTLDYGQLIRFLEPALRDHETIHVYLDETMPRIHGKLP